MENKFLEMTVEEMNEVNGGSWFGRIIGYCVSCPIFIVSVALDTVALGIAGCFDSKYWKEISNGIDQCEEFAMSIEKSIENSI